METNCLTSNGSLAAWLLVLCSWVLCSVLVCELCLNVFLQLDVQRDVPALMSHGIWFHVAAFLLALISLLSFCWLLVFMKPVETLFLLGFCFSVKLGENWPMGKIKKLFGGVWRDTHTAGRQFSGTWEEKQMLIWAVCASVALWSAQRIRIFSCSFKWAVPPPRFSMWGCGYVVVGLIWKWMHRLQYRRKKAENLKSKPYLVLLHTVRENCRLWGETPWRESWWHIYAPGGWIVPPSHPVPAFAALLLLRDWYMFYSLSS